MNRIQISSIFSVKMILIARCKTVNKNGHLGVFVFKFVLTLQFNHNRIIIGNFIYERMLFPD